MPSNICLHSFAQQVRDLVFMHPDGISDEEVARQLDATRARVRTVVRDDRNMVVTDPFFITQTLLDGREVYFPRDERTEYSYRPRKKIVHVAPEANPADVIRPYQGELSPEEIGRATGQGAPAQWVSTPPASIEETRRETFPEMMDRMATELARRYLEDAPAVGVKFSMLFAAKVRAQQEGGAA